MGILPFMMTDWLWYVAGTLAVGTALISLYIFWIAR